MRAQIIKQDRDTYADSYMGDVRAVRGADKRWRVTYRAPGNEWRTVKARIGRKAEALALAADCAAARYGTA